MYVNIKVKRGSLHSPVQEELHQRVGDNGIGHELVSLLPRLSHDGKDVACILVGAISITLLQNLLGKRNKEPVGIIK